MISAQQRQPPRLPPSLSKKPEQERRIQLQGTCNRVLKDLITIEGGSITTLGKGTIPFVLLMLMIEGGSGTTIDIFFRCFVDKKGMETKLKRRLHGMRTYDYYILAMREKNQFTVMDPFDELDSSSDESSDFDSPESPRQTLISKFMCKKEDEMNT
uniref:Uncharacterized protein n=1 Tax=Brassica oleracea TaxID=3712 RepID=A0A3P6ED01_BRAOL|nr:unnamed protein product [Brassica oleracea]